MQAVQTFSYPHMRARDADKLGRHGYAALDCRVHSSTGRFEVLMVEYLG